MNKLLLTVFFIPLAIYPIQEVEIVTHNVLPPYAFTNDKDELTGIYIEIVKAVVNEMPDYSVSFLVMPWERGKVMVKEGKAFALLPPYNHSHDWLTDNEPKRPYMLPYSVPLYAQRDVVIFWKNASNIEFNEYPDDLKGYSVGMVRGDGRAGVEFHKLVDNGEIALNLYNDYENLFTMLVLERIHGLIISSASFYWYLKEFKESRKFYIDANDFEEVFLIGSNEGHLGYTDIDDEVNYPFKDDFVTKFDAAYLELEKVGAIQKIVDLFIK